MKIGILTHHYVKNFGAYMQAAGLLTIIKMKYPKAEVEFINYKITKHRYLCSRHFFGFKYVRGDTIKGWLKKIKLFFIHTAFEKKLPLSKTVMTAHDINKLSYDLIIIGSDEVWNFNDIAYSPIKFGKGIDAPIISYSASSGGSSVNDKVPEEISDCLEKFQSIAVRDERTEDLVRKLTKHQVMRTVDPVFLCNFQLKCSKKIKTIASQRPFILIYDCQLTDTQIARLSAFAREREMNILGAGEYRNWYTTLDTVDITPYEWAYLFKYAWGIVTGTFHGTAFSLKYNKKFVAYLTEKNRINKVGSLLWDLGLYSRIVLDRQKDDLLNILEQDIEYEIVNKYLREETEKSLRYLYKQIDFVTSQ